MLSSNNIKTILSDLFSKSKEEHDKDINHLKTNMNKGWISSGTIEQLHGISDTSAPFDYYSEEELLIGQWVDGKPLYRSIRSINTDSSNKSLTIDISDLNIDKVIKSNGFFKRRNNNGFIPLPINYSVAYCYYDILDTNKNKITLVRDMSTHWSDVTFYCYFEYTKTTDTSIDKKEIVANGINMQLYDGTHYSEDELLIGQWIDGKPLYRKVVPFTYPAGSTYYEGDIKAIDVTDVENIWISDGWLDQGNDISHLNNYYTSSCYCYTSIHKSNDKWYIYARQMGFNNRNAVAIINYTKTTDTPFSVDEDIAWVALDSDVNDVLNNIGE